MKKFPFFFFFLLLLIGSFFTLILGDTPFDLVWQGILDRIAGLSSRWNPLLDERVPRLIVLACTGAALAVSGAVTQAIFQNPLASPSVLGIPSGGSLLVVLVFILELHFKVPFAIPLAAFVGCLGTLLIVYGLSRRKGSVEMSNMVLTGIAISTLIITLQGAITYAFRDRWHLMQTLTEWEAGSTLDRNWSHVHMQLPLTIFGLLGCTYYSKEINMMAFGEDEALNLGVEVDKVRWRLFLCISLLISGSIAAVGTVAFFGLILPHLMRQFSGPDNCRLIPLTMVGGSSILIIIDVFLRYFELHTFSIGNLSTIIGGLFFICLLFGNRSQQYGLLRGSGRA